MREKSVAEELREVMKHWLPLAFGSLERICAFILDKLRSYYRTNLHLKSADL